MVRSHRAFAQNDLSSETWQFCRQFCLIQPHSHEVLRALRNFQFWKSAFALCVRTTPFGIGSSTVEIMFQRIKTSVLRLGSSTKRSKTSVLRLGSSTKGSSASEVRFISRIRAGMFRIRYYFRRLVNHRLSTDISKSSKTCLHYS